MAESSSDSRSSSARPTTLRHALPHKFNILGDLCRTALTIAKAEMAERVEDHVPAFHAVMEQVFNYCLSLQCDFMVHFHLPELEYLPSVRGEFEMLEYHLCPLTRSYRRHESEFKARMAHQPRPNDVPADYHPHIELGRMMTMLENFLSTHELLQNSWPTRTSVF